MEETNNNNQTEPTPAPETTAPPQSNKWPMVGGLVLIIAIVLGAAWYFGGGAFFQGMLTPQPTATQEALTAGEKPLMEINQVEINGQKVALGKNLQWMGNKIKFNGTLADPIEFSILNVLDTQYSASIKPYYVLTAPQNPDLPNIKTIQPVLPAPAAIGTADIDTTAEPSPATENPATPATTSDTVSTDVTVPAATETPSSVGANATAAPAQPLTTAVEPSPVNKVEPPTIQPILAQPAAIQPAVETVAPVDSINAVTQTSVLTTEKAITDTSINSLTPDTTLRTLTTGTTTTTTVPQLTANQLPNLTVTAPSCTTKFMPLYAAKPDISTDLTKGNLIVTCQPPQDTNPDALYQISVLLKDKAFFNAIVYGFPKASTIDLSGSVSDRTGGRQTVEVVAPTETSGGTTGTTGSILPGPTPTSTLSGIYGERLVEPTLTSPKVGFPMPVVDTTIPGSGSTGGSSGSSGSTGGTSGGGVSSGFSTSGGSGAVSLALAELNKNVETLKQKELALADLLYEAAGYTNAGKPIPADLATKIAALQKEIKALRTQVGTSNISDKCNTGDQIFQIVCRRGLIEKYNPKAIIKRFEIALIYSRLAEIIKNKTVTIKNTTICSLFTDYGKFSKEAWATPFCTALKTYGILKGSNQLVRTEYNITYVENYRALYQLYLNLGLIKSYSGDNLLAALNYFRSANPDFQLTTDNRWYVEAVQFALNQKLNLVRPSHIFDFATRADVTNDIYQLTRSII